MKKKNFKNSSFIIFLIIAIVYAIGNYIWWILNTPILPKNICAVCFRHVFENSFLYEFAPLETWIMKSMFFFFNKDYFDLHVIITNYIFFLIALYFIYKIGVELKNKETGNIAMILFALVPGIYIASRQYGHQDWHVMIALVPNIYCLIKSDSFNNRKWSVFYGITVGIGLLIKDSFIMYFFIPWLYIVIRSLLEETNRKKIVNILITILIGISISCCHYFRACIIRDFLSQPVSEATNIFTFDSLRVMTISISDRLLSPPIFILFIISLIWIIFKYNKNKKHHIVLLWLLVPWIVLILMPHRKLIEYAFGFVPAMVLVTSLWISDFKSSLIKQMICLFLIIVCFLQFLDFSYNINTRLFNFRAKINNKKICYFDREDTENSLFVFFMRNNYFQSLLFYLKIKNLKLATPEPENMMQMMKFDVIIYEENVSILDINNIFDMIGLTAVNTDLDFRVKKNRDAFQKKINEIKDNYIQIDDFYVDPKRPFKRNHIFVLGKKELFEGKENIIKKPYKLLKLKKTKKVIQN